MNRQIFSKENETPALRDYVYTIANEVLMFLRNLPKKTIINWMSSC